MQPYILPLLQFSFHSKWSTVNVSNCPCFSKQRLKMFQRVILTLEVEKWPQYRVPKEIQCRFLLEHFFFNKKRNKKVFRKEYFQIALRIFFAHFFCLKIWFYTWPHLSFLRWMQINFRLIHFYTKFFCRKSGTKSNLQSTSTCFLILNSQDT